jgi:carbonic anhydrase
MSLRKPELAWQELLAGNRRYVAGASLHPHQSADRRAEVAHAQHPFAVVIGCSDSRVPPELIFDCGLGDLFVIRTAGHALDEMAYASAQYAIEHLGAPLIVVLGHTHCGAVKSVVDGAQTSAYLSLLVERLRPAVTAASRMPGNLLDNAVLENVRQTVTRLATTIPYPSDLSAKGLLTIIGAHYDLESGLVTPVEA